MKEENKSIDKKLNILLILVVISLVLNFIVLGKVSNTGVKANSSTSPSETEENTEYDVSDFEEIKASDIKNLNKNEYSVIYIGRETCGWCLKMLPNLKTAQKEFGYTTKYIDIAKIIDFSNSTITDQDAYDTMINLDAVEAEKDTMKDFGGTPMMLIMKNGKIVASQVGYSEYEEFAEVLTKAGLKK